MRLQLSFPRTVDERAARLVATGVVAMSAGAIVFRQPWLFAVLLYGFVARVLAGPRFSPLALAATRVIVPALRGPARPVPGPPKRFAQGIGALFSATAALLHFGLGATGAAYLVIGALGAAAALEAFAGLCLGCKIFAQLMRWGLVPASVCVECTNISARLAVSAERSTT